MNKFIGFSFYFTTGEVTAQMNNEALVGEHIRNAC